MSAQKLTASARKLRTWESVRALDKRALALLAAGADLEAAYRQAMNEQQIAFRADSHWRGQTQLWPNGDGNC